MTESTDGQCVVQHKSLDGKLCESCCHHFQYSSSRWMRCHQCHLKAILGTADCIGHESLRSTETPECMYCARETRCIAKHPLYKPCCKCCPAKIGPMEVPGPVPIASHQTVMETRMEDLAKRVAQLECAAPFGPLFVANFCEEYKQQIASCDPTEAAKMFNLLMAFCSSTASTGKQQQSFLGEEKPPS